MSLMPRTMKAAVLTGLKEPLAIAELNMPEALAAVDPGNELRCAGGERRLNPCDGRCGGRCGTRAGPVSSSRDVHSAALVC